MTQAALESTCITSGVNEARFLEHLKMFFSTSTTVLAECLQNARRAGATSVVFDYVVHDSILTITDNGSGIADFHALITVAESGWSQDMIDSERPFGIGFFSVSFAADSIRVESNGKQIEFSSEDLIAKRQIVVEPSGFMGGTRITLSRCKLDASKINDALIHYARGFAIPVFWRGLELSRPDAQVNLAGVQTSVGFVHVAGIHNDRMDSHLFLGTAYCQGLPVHVRGFSSGHFERRGAIVHVDHLRYTPRMPDRACLIDQDEACREFEQVLKDIWRSHLVAKKAEMSAADFVEAFWSISDRTGCLDLMADVPVLPAGILHYVGETPALYGDGDSFWNKNKTPLTRAEVESGAVMLFRDFDETDCGGDNFTRLMWAWEARAIFLDHYQLPENHWVIPLLRDLAKEPMKVGGRVVACGHFDGGWVRGNVKLIDKLGVRIAGITHALTSAVAVGSSVWRPEKTFLVPTGAGYVGDVVRQVSAYINDNDSFCETDYELDADSFNDLVMIMSGEPADKTLWKCLNGARAQKKMNLRKTSFRVQFDADGNMTITAE